VVCRNIAVLCTYEQGSGTEVNFRNREPLRLSGGLETYQENIEPLLKWLSSGDLGGITVLAAMALRDEQISGDHTSADDPNLYVFLGDLHLPVMSEPELSVENSLGDGEVMRWGRLTLTPRVEAEAAAIALSLVPAAPIVAQVLPQIVNDPQRAEDSGLPLNPTNVRVAAIATLPLLPNAVKETLVSAVVVGPIDVLLAMDLWCTEQIYEGFPEPGDDGVMTEGEARDWAARYIGTPDQKGADIFQGAAKDLVTFLSLLEQFPGPTPQLTQLGDLNDFWIGMKCAFTEQVYLLPGAEDFVNHWKRMALRSKRSGPAIQKIRALPAAKTDAKIRSIPVHLVSGNHDNYLRRTDGVKTNFVPEHGLLYSEHGHQSDSFNCDDDARAGWAITQLAYLFPAFREYEDPAAAFITRLKRLCVNAPGARLERIARAADVCSAEEKSIYVMGHTHQPMLKRIVVKQALDTQKFFKNVLERLVEDGKGWLKDAEAFGKAMGALLQSLYERFKAYCLAKLHKLQREARRTIAKLMHDLDEFGKGVAEGVRETVQEVRAELDKARQTLERAARSTWDESVRLAKEAQQRVEAAVAKLEELGNWAADRVKAGIKFLIQEFHRKVAELSEAMKRFAVAAQEYAKRAIAKLRQAWTDVWNWVKKVLHQIEAAIVKAAKAVAAAATSALDWLVQEANNTWRSIADFFKEVENSIERAFANLDTNFASAAFSQY
jgi:UDP-2,3-diacylglucosamine pyrophosphatase LpxH/predicted transcriptional regulator YdeE